MQFLRCSGWCFYAAVDFSVFTFLKMASMDGVCLPSSPALFCRSSTDSATLKQGFD